MKILKGTPITERIAFGKLHFYKKTDLDIKKREVLDITEELKKYEDTKKIAVGQLKDLYEKTLKTIGEEEAMIFDVHQMMLLDDEYNDYIKDIIEKNLNAEYAINEAKNEFKNMFLAMDSEYMRARSVDICDISDRLINIILGNSNSLNFEEPVILAAEDLTPSETVSMDKEKILGFVTTAGSKNSHTAILAKMLDLPALIGVDKEVESFHGENVIVCGASGQIYVNPDEETTNDIKQKVKEQEEAKDFLKSLIGQENVTKDGRKIDIFSNIGNVYDVTNVIKNDAGGIGLFRSEFLYLDSKDYPTEQDQFFAYKTVLEKMHGKKVIVRTLDIGADKQVDYFGLEKEENPALGMRAIRICLTRPDIFKTQLRALFRASSFGNLAIMFPMIISVEEVLKSKLIIEEVKKELEKEGHPYADNVEIGIMIETPAAAIISDLLAKEVDFFSIGTNDLTSYVTAIDRQNLSLAEFDNPYHPAVLRMIEQTTKNAKDAGIWVGICGELAADTNLTEYFLKIGIDELSVSPPYVLPLRNKVRSL
ncbi:MAG: phosphoenolpyruvate--protein phosphotransferase [Defluviitaleaceae bacterium]|nr:phosphoenolpyruvate--protein phosphotransferase [Defluviitaleaceae bacterium]